LRRRIDYFKRDEDRRSRNVLPVFFTISCLAERGSVYCGNRRISGYKVLRLLTNDAEKSAMYSQIKKTGKFSGKLKTAEGKRRRR
jgi:hypothetical protein